MSILTVLMSVKNGEPYLRETVESILNQTYKDFEFLIVDNASTDNTREIIRSFNDPRIRLIELPEDIGQAAALNKGLDMIDTPLVARMDADDISMPQRFERQVTFMESHPFVGVCGTFASTFRGKKEKRYSWPCQSADLKVKLLFECTIPHPTVMLRKSLFDKFRLRYNEQIGHSYDWELWERASQHFDLANIPEYHLKYRLHEKSESIRTLGLQEAAAKKVDDASLTRLGLENHPLRHIHRDVAFETFNARDRDPEFLQNVVRWFRQLEAANRSHGVYEKNALNTFLKERLFIVLTNNTGQRIPVLKIFFKEKLYLHIRWTWTMKLMVKLLWSLFKIRTEP